jgi:hypothetical protein
MEREHELTGYEMYLLAGSNNPANDLAAHSFPLWACELVLSQTGPYAYLPEGELIKWALIEALNTGSFQRAALPITLPDSWRGSGRWLAGDHGGWLQHLRDRTVSWCGLPSDQKRLFHLAASHRLIQIRDVEAHRDRARKIRAGQYFEVIIGEHLYGVDLAENMIRRVNDLTLISWEIHDRDLLPEGTAAEWSALPFAPGPEGIVEFAAGPGWQELRDKGVYLAMETNAESKPEETGPDGEWLQPTGRCCFFRVPPVAPEE